MYYLSSVREEVFVVPGDEIRVLGMQPRVLPTRPPDMEDPWGLDLAGARIWCQDGGIAPNSTITPLPESASEAADDDRAALRPAADLPEPK
jgi:hypothetical protein